MAGSEVMKMTMKKHIFAAALALLLLLAMLPAAYADVIYPAPAPVQAGSEIDHLVATVDYGVQVSVMDATFPVGVALYAENGAAGMDLYLRGLPMNAGVYNCMFTVGEASMSCPLTVEPASPIVLGVSSDVTCSVNEPVQLAVSAYSPDGGTLSYQWYLGQIGSGAMIAGDFSSISVGTTVPGTSYYYCVVTNTNNGYSKSAR